VAAAAFPDLTRPDAGTLVIGSRYAGDAGRQRRLVEKDAAALDAVPWPAACPSTPAQGTAVSRRLWSPHRATASTAASPGRRRHGCPAV
jgi:hypothetical protein